MTPREVEEYRALRDTIRERGTARIWIFVAGLTAWVAAAIATAALASLPLATLLPLVLLYGVFEAIFALHVAVERIGRYIQVFFEPGSGWEHAAMAFGKAPRGTAVDPLFANVFLFATVMNFVPVLIADPVAIEIVVIGALHVAFLARVVAARRAAAAQRAADLDRFRALRAAGDAATPAH